MDMEELINEITYWTKILLCKTSTLTTLTEWLNEFLMKYDKLQNKQNQAKNFHFLPSLFSWKKTAIMTSQHQKRKSMEISPVQANIPDNLLEIVCKAFHHWKCFPQSRNLRNKTKNLTILDFSVNS